MVVALLAEGVDRNASDEETIRDALVALLAEGVDRNRTDLTFALIRVVALLAEGVDRNKAGQGIQSIINGRPPRGGRG